MFQKNVLLVLAYFVTGRLGVTLAATGGGYAAPVWFPTGLAIAAILAWGWKAVPGIWLGAFLTNYSIGAAAGPSQWQTLWVAACIATGNSLEAVLARLLLTRAFHFSRRLKRTSDVLAYVVTAAVAPVVSAAIGVASLYWLTANLGDKDVGDTLLTWWIGDSVGAVLLAPLLFSSGQEGREAGGRALPYVLLASTLATLLIDVRSSIHLQPILSAVLVVATLLTCSIRLSLRRLSYVILLISLAAIYRAHQGFGLYALIPDRVQRMLLMQFVVGSATVMAMTLNAVVSERLQAREEAHRRELALLAAGRAAAIGEMAAGIAHEINNPLTVLSSRAQLLISQTRPEQPSTEDVRASAEKILAMTERIAKIVRSLQFFSRKADHDPFEEVPLRKIVDETRELCAKHFEGSGVTLEIDPIAEDLVLSCRPVEVGQLILNLLSNAAAAARSPDPGSGRGGWVKLSARRAGDELELSVTDSGHGVPAEIRGRIFDPFFTTKPPGLGLGLGLSLAREIVAVHGGRLQLDETSPHTRFVAHLPCPEPEPIDPSLQTRRSESAFPKRS